jgi:hypothetical protein
MESSDEASQGPVIEALVIAIAVCVLGLCLAAPWIGLWWLGSWACAGGAVLSHVLYYALLAPKQGVCLGVAWIFVFLNSIAALIVAFVAALV